MCYNPSLASAQHWISLSTQTLNIKSILCRSKSFMNLKINVRSRRNGCNSFLIKMVHFSRSHGLGHHLSHLVSCIYGFMGQRLSVLCLSQLVVRHAASIPGERRSTECDDGARHCTGVYSTVQYSAVQGPAPAVQWDNAHMNGGSLGGGR